MTVIKTPQGYIVDLSPKFLGVNEGGWWDPLGQAIAWLADTIKSFVDWVTKPIRDAVSWIWDALKGFAEWAKQAVGGLFNLLQKAWDVLARVGAIVMDSVGGVLAGLWNTIVSGLGGLAQAVWNAIQGAMDAIGKALGWIVDRVRDGLMFMYNKLVELAPRSLEEVPLKIPALLSVVGLAGLGAALATDIASLNIFGSGLDLKGVKDFLKDVFSPGLVQGVLVGSIVTAGIQPFVQRWVRSQFRTWLPGLKETFVLWRQGYFTTYQRDQIFRQHGVPDQLIPHVVELMDYTPPVRDLVRISQYADPDLEWLKSKLVENGVVDSDIPKYLEMFVNMSLRRLHDEIYAELEKSLYHGVPPRESFEKILNIAKFRDWLKPYYIMLYEIVLNRYRTLWWVEAWEEQLYRNLITPEIFVERLVGIGVDKQIAVARAVKQMARRGVYWEAPGV